MLWFNSPCTATYNREFAPIDRKNSHKSLIVPSLEVFQRLFFFFLTRIYQFSEKVLWELCTTSPVQGHIYFKSPSHTQKRWCIILKIIIIIMFCYFCEYFSVLGNQYITGIMLKIHSSISLSKFSSNLRETFLFFFSCVCSYEKHNRNCGKKKGIGWPFPFSRGLYEVVSMISNKINVLLKI